MHNKTESVSNQMVMYPGADIEIAKDGQYWIHHDNGVTGPFATYDLAAAEIEADLFYNDHCY